MAINQNYNEELLLSAIAEALNNFYIALVKKIDSLSIKTVMRKKNPYLFRAKDMQGAAQIVEAILSAYVSSSEETIFGNLFFEPIATAAVQGQKALAQGVDIMVEKDDVIYAIAVKSGPNVFNSSSKKKQEQDFSAAAKLAQQAKKRFVPIIGYSYGKKKKGQTAVPKFYTELAGQEFWEELTGDSEFYLKLIHFIELLPKTHIDAFEAAYQKAENRLVKEFTQLFCRDDGSIDWDALVTFNSGN